MRSAWLLRPLVLLHLLLFAQLAGAVTSSQQAYGLNQLQRARDAAARLDYSGTLIYQQGPELKISRISHRHEGSHYIERVELLDGPPREYVRRGEDITWYLLPEKRLIFDRQANVRSFPGLLSLNKEYLTSHYRLEALPDDRVAARSSKVIQLQPLDGLRYGYRFWLDMATGIMLRAQSISETGEVVEQIGFSDLKVGAVSAKRERSIDTRGWRVERAVSGTADITGWRFSLPNGFQQIAAQRRRLGQPRAGAVQTREVIQVICSDGLAGISIFIEPWSAERAANPVQRGAVNMVGKRLGKFWLTIAGEVPMAAVRQVADSLEFSAPANK